MKRAKETNWPNSEDIGKAVCNIDYIQSNNLGKILNKINKSIPVNKKFRISHLTPNRYL